MKNKGKTPDLKEVYAKATTDSKIVVNEYSFCIHNEKADKKITVTIRTIFNPKLFNIDFK